MAKTDYRVDVRPGAFRANIDFDAAEKSVMDKLDKLSTALTHVDIAKTMLAHFESDIRRAKSKKPLSDEELARLRGEEFELGERLGNLDPQQANANIKARISTIQGKQVHDLGTAKAAVGGAKVLLALPKLASPEAVQALADIAGEFIGITEIFQKQAYSTEDALKTLKENVTQFHKIADKAAAAVTSELSNVVGKVAFGVVRHQGQNARMDLSNHGASKAEANVLTQHKDSFELAGERAIKRLYGHAEKAPQHIKVLVSRSFNNATSAVTKNSDGLEIATKAKWLGALDAPSFKMDKAFQKAAVASSDTLRKDVADTLKMARAASLDIEIPHRLVSVISKKFRSSKQPGLEPTVLFRHEQFISVASSCGQGGAPTNQTSSTEVAQAGISHVLEELELCDVILTRELLSDTERADQIQQAKTGIEDIRADLKQVVDADSVAVTRGKDASPEYFSDLRKGIHRDLNDQREDRISAKLFERMQASSLEFGRGPADPTARSEDESYRGFRPGGTR